MSDPNGVIGSWIVEFGKYFDRIHLIYSYAAYQDDKNKALKAFSKMIFDIESFIRKVLDTLPDNYGEISKNDSLEITKMIRDNLTTRFHDGIMKCLSVVYRKPSSAFYTKLKTLRQVNLGQLGVRQRLWLTEGISDSPCPIQQQQKDQQKDQQKEQQKDQKELQKEKPLPATPQTLPQQLQNSQIQPASKYSSLPMEINDVNAARIDSRPQSFVLPKPKTPPLSLSLGRQYSQPPLPPSSISLEAQALQLAQATQVLSVFEQGINPSVSSPLLSNSSSRPPPPASRPPRLVSRQTTEIINHTPGKSPSPAQLFSSSSYCTLRRQPGGNVKSQQLNKMAWGANILPPDTPYLASILQLRELTNKKNAYSKSRVIVATAAAIISCINDYYHAHPEQKQPSDLGADDLQPLMTFIVIKANVPDLHAHIAFIRQFADPQILEMGELEHKLCQLEITCQFVSTLLLDVKDDSGYLVAMASLDRRFSRILNDNKESQVRKGSSMPTLWLSDLLLKFAAFASTTEAAPLTKMLIDAEAFPMVTKKDYLDLLKSLMKEIHIEILSSSSSTATTSSSSSPSMALKDNKTGTPQLNPTPSPMLGNGSGSFSPSASSATEIPANDSASSTYAVFSVLHPPHVYTHFSRLVEKLASSKKKDNSSRK
eukprot:TRINITY_DN2719_c0_g1_i1.p1 TRINITY_DN2719_c0_g1~~TRINITY_DN2719_c0_g1_i1.p1  ORF type:complete len:733 (-),score=258.01 TRINITY_DN2719_c0_g1_i1:133-2094(-)